MGTLGQRQQVGLDYDAFTRLLNRLLIDHRDELASIRDGEVIGFDRTPGVSRPAGSVPGFDEMFLVHKATDEPIDLGFWSHVGR